MSNVGLLVSYKLKSFFAPSYRGRFGPLPLIGLSLAFIPSGLSIGYAMGQNIVGSDPEFVVNFLGSALSAMMVFGFVFALGVGITAHPSELDFIMTTPVKPREYLIADMLFQFGSLTIAGGMTILFAVFGFLWGAEDSLLLAVPVLLLMGLYGLMVFFMIQSLTVLKIRYPYSRVRAVILLLLVLSVVPMVSLASSDFPLSFADMPIPQAAFGSLVFAALDGSGFEVRDAAVAAVYLGAVSALWARLSVSYYFHGVKPTLSAGFGQVDMSVKMAQQKRMIRGIGRFTTKISLRTDSGGELSLMTRLNLIRFWRDGSFVFVGILLAIFVGTAIMQAQAEDSSGVTVNLLQAGAWPIAILAVNWCYYERENLWIPVVGGRSLEAYFRGLMLALIIVGIGVAALIIAVLFAVGMTMGIADLAFMTSMPIAGAAIGTIFMTRFKVKPGAFSPGLLVVLFGTILCAAAISGAIWMMVGAIGDSDSVMVAMQLAVAITSWILICAIGLSALTRSARRFRFA